MAKKKKKRSNFKKKKRFTFNLSSKIKQNILNKRFSNVYDLDKVISEENTERVVNNAGKVEKYGDFKYQDGGIVPVGEPYHIHYSRIGKSEIYMTGKSHSEVSMVIDRVRGNTTFGQYVKVKPDVKSSTYLNEHIFKVTNKQRKIGIARRYFAQQVNQNPFAFEIKKADWQKPTPLYNKVEIKWTLSLNQNLMEQKNIEEIDKAILKGFNSLEYSLNPTEGFIGDEVSTRGEVIQRLDKLSSIKVSKKKRNKRNKKKRIRRASNTQSTTSTTQTAPPSSGGGAY
tara:strand:- start:35 stop:886 length:852 start_codon:yes stop_codon:yes gene_type:complete